jgi:IclR helix-turn-helix domain
MCAQAIHDGLTANSNGARFQFRSSPDARGYAPMDAVIEDTDLDLAVRFTYLIVKQLAWSGPDAALTTDDIARILGRSPGQAYRYLQELVEAGLLSVESKSFDSQPDIYCLEPLEGRYGPSEREGSPMEIAGGIAGKRGKASGVRRGLRENRGAVIPAMTDERRAYEDRLAARIPALAPVPSIDPRLRELGIDRARRLRQQLTNLAATKEPG